LKNKVYSGAVLRACQILGGPDEVARRAGVSRLLIKAILKDSLVPPPSVFLKIVDILMSAEGTEAHRPS
jgi:predicted transcriptional regulator